jgi:hypothetical protein
MVSWDRARQGMSCWNIRLEIVLFIDEKETKLNLEKMKQSTCANVCKIDIEI